MSLWVRPTPDPDTASDKAATIDDLIPSEAVQSTVWSPAQLIPSRDFRPPDLIQNMISSCFPASDTASKLTLAHAWENVWCRI